MAARLRPRWLIPILFKGDRKELLTVTFMFRQIIGLVVPVERRAELDAFVAALESHASA